MVILQSLGFQDIISSSAIIISSKCNQWNGRGYGYRMFVIKKKTKIDLDLKIYQQAGDIFHNLELSRELGSIYRTTV